MSKNVQLIEILYELVSLIPLVLTFMFWQECKKDLTSYGAALNGGKIFLEGKTDEERNRFVAQFLLSIPGVSSMFFPSVGVTALDVPRFIFIALPFFLVQFVILYNTIVARKNRRKMIDYAISNITDDQRVREQGQNTREETQNSREKEQNVRDTAQDKRERGQDNRDLGLGD